MKRERNAKDNKTAKSQTKSVSEIKHTTLLSIH